VLSSVGADFRPDAEMGLNAGVAMVFRNIQAGNNNGHAVALMRLADGRES